MDMGFARIVLVGFALLGTVSLTGCASDEPDTYAEAHHRWWREHHHDDAYDARRAYHDHHGWCEDHPADDSCAGWTHR